MLYEIETQVKRILFLIALEFVFVLLRDKAHSVFLEAIKCNYDNWKVWENFLWVN